MVADCLERENGVSLNVKDPEAHRLAQAISAETGDSLTKVVIDSLRERHAQLEKRKGKASLGELMAIAKRASRAAKRPYVDHGELLYDERGLPK
jgi:antitoxin VapB